MTLGQYVFWYENERSLTAKLSLIDKYSLKGSGCWSLGQEASNTWEYFSKNLGAEANQDEIINGLFKDVSENYWAYKAIYWAKDKGYVNGRSNGLFEPNGTLTRAELATLICRIYGYTYDLTGDFYADISNHWAREAINALSQRGIVNGYGNGLFMPDKAVTREEVAKVLSFWIEEPSNAKTVYFLDVSDEKWSYDAIQKLASAGIVKGYTDGSFKPSGKITRAEMVTIIERIFD